ncbi:hypothetical protein [Demequina sp. NBRC 110053]|uniref:hypothetical protein n=1 Tax=Demequina sp. NBRC 110053 TaxID=1570342 RepID=UPI000A0566E3|nr:hypothetical protein [Demequina sp. NBRC 110053]
MSLTDRYVAATLSRTPVKQRDEVEADLRAAIADAIDARLDAGALPDAPDRASALETAVLNEMGDPDRLAADYADRPLMLIGPRLFLQWRRLTILLLWIVLPIIAVLIPFGMWLGDESLGAIIGSTVGGTLTVGVHLVFWVTLVFAILERAGTPADELSEPWTVERLKESPDVRVSGVETAVALATLAIGAALIVWQQLWPWATTADGEVLPVLNPDLWTFVLPALLAVMAVEAVVVVARQVRGRWTMGDWWLTLALDVAALILVAVPVLQHDLLNRALFEEIGWPDAATTVTLEQVEWVVLIVVAVVSVADAWGTWTRARRGSRT